jgi:hypothetical protein
METYVIVSNDSVNGVTYTTTTTWTMLNNSAQNTLWEKKQTVVATTLSNLSQTRDPDFASLLPGTYTDIKVSCPTSLAKGVYIIDGGELKITGTTDMSTFCPAGMTNDDVVANEISTVKLVV